MSRRGIRQKWKWIIARMEVDEDREERRKGGSGRKGKRSRGVTVETAGDGGGRNGKQVEGRGGGVGM